MLTNNVVLQSSSSMNEGVGLPALYLRDERAATRVVEFFTVNIRNPNTRAAYGHAAASFAAWCEVRGIVELAHVQPIHIAAYIEGLQGTLSAPSIKVQLAGLRMLFDCLVVGQVIPLNPAHAVRGPKYSAKKGKTPVLTAEEARELFDSIDVSELIGLRDRALIALMTFSFARVGAAAAEKMRVRDVYVQGRRLWIRLHEKGGKRHEMPCHHLLEDYLLAYIEAAGLAHDPDGFLFRTMRGHTGLLSDRAMTRNDVYRMIRRRAAAADLKTRIGCHTCRATGITVYLTNGGNKDTAQMMANHADPRTTGLYDRRADGVSLAEVERILI